MKHLVSEHISHEDFLRLKQNPQPYARAAIARKMASCFDTASPDSATYQVAAEIALYLQKDKNDKVRITLAEGVQQSATAPKTLILLLANDSQDEVAVPILRHSPLLEEEDLTRLVKETQSQVRLVAMAERKFLSVGISALLTEKAYEKVVVTLLDNETSSITDITYLRMAELHKQSNMVLQQMMKRFPLPAEAIERMKAETENKDQENRPPLKGMQSFAVLPPQELRNIALTVMMLGEYPGAEQCMMLARQFQAQGRINAPVLLIILTQGQIGLLFACLSVATGIPYEEIEQNYANQPDKLNILLVKAGISPSLLILMQWIWKGVIVKLEQGLQPSSKQMIKLMSILLREGARRGVNFANTIGLPIANMLDNLI